MTSSGPAVPNYGAVFTRRWVVEALLDLTGYTADRDLGGMHLLEPSCGSGAFLGPAVERLIASARRQGRDLASLGDAVRAYDLRADHVEVCRTLCRDLLAAAGGSAALAAALAARWVRRADFLFSDLFSLVEDRLADVVVGNPPYIRYDDLSPDLEPGGHYPHHNLYYVVSDTWDMEVLGGLLLSRIAQAFIEAYCVRMRGGTLRFQAQYLKRIRVPRSEEIAPATREALRAAFQGRDTEAATLAAADAYGIDLKDYELARPDTGRPDGGSRFPVLDQAQ